MGDVPITKYETPGGQEFADTVLPFVKKSNVIILANHGTVSFGETVERAYWWTEILDAYCRILMLARDLGKVNYFTEQKTRELLDLKQKWGFTDPRLTPGMKNCDICANDIVPRQLGQQRASSASASSRRRRWATGARGRGAQGRAARRPATPDMRAMRCHADCAANADQEALIRAITERVMAALAQTAK